MLQEGRVAGVVLEGGEELQADIYILAAGVASPSLAAQAGVNIPVYPLKGHMATLQVMGLARNIYSPRYDNTSYSAAPAPTPTTATPDRA